MITDRIRKQSGDAPADTPRQELRALRDALRENPSLSKEADSGDAERMLDFLDHEDPKTRKNACAVLELLLPYLPEEEKKRCADHLFQCWQKEETLFVRSSYLSALMQTDYSAFTDAFRKRLTFLEEGTFDESEQKHLREERRLLEELLAGHRSGHKVQHFSRPYEMLLLCDDVMRPGLADALNHSQDARNARPVPGGVRVRILNDRILESTRTFREGWFLIPVRKGFACTRQTVKDLPKESMLLPMLSNLLGGAPEDSYTFRMELLYRSGKDPRGHGGSSETPEKRRDLDRSFVRTTSFEIEESSGGKLMNLPGQYECTLILRERPDGRISPFLRLEEADHRFDYRKVSLPTSMTPARAAETVSLIRPYLKENAQVMDPFSGVGTLLIERCLSVPAHDIYATDIFGKAVLGGRENAEAAGVRIQFINRDFFDFQHEYLFDEILTEFPDLHGQSSQDKNDFYQDFFDHALTLVTSDARLFLISGEEGQIRRNIRVHEGLRLVRKIPLRRRQDIYIIERSHTSEDSSAGNEKHPE